MANVYEPALEPTDWEFHNEVGWTLCIRQKNSPLARFIYLDHEGSVCDLDWTPTFPAPNVAPADHLLHSTRKSGLEERFNIKEVDPYIAFTGPTTQFRNSADFVRWAKYAIIKKTADENSQTSSKAVASSASAFAPTSTDRIHARAEQKDKLHDDKVHELLQEIELQHGVRMTKHLLREMVSLARITGTGLFETEAFKALKNATKAP